MWSTFIFKEKKKEKNNFKQFTLVKQISWRILPERLTFDRD